MRSWLVSIHLWLALVLGLLWALQGLTGASLVFHRELDRLGGPAVQAGPMASLDGIIGAAAQHTGGKIQMIGIADGKGDLLNLHYKEGDVVRQLRIEAATGKIAETRDYDPPHPGSGWWRWVYMLHESLLLHDRGETLIGLSGLFLMTALGTGLWIGWPRAGQLRAIFAARQWRTTRTRLYGWHRLVGLGAGLVLVVTIPGGVWMIFADSLRPVVARHLSHQLPYKARPAETLAAAIGPQAALDRARALFPSAAFVRLTWPTAAAPVYAVRLRQPGEIRAWSGVTSVVVDASSGRILSTYDPLTAPWTNRAADAAFSVHSAEIAGPAGRLLLMLAGLSLPALYVTGIWAWWRKRRPRGAKARSARGRSRLELESA